MNSNVNGPDPGLPNPTMLHVIARLGEIEASLAALDAAWDCAALSDVQRRRAVSNSRRCLIDAVCDLEASIAPS